ncbi:MAG TPA: HAD hydrolase-like protein, partial [Candidatus Methylacidiphilales bacterium]
MRSSLLLWDIDGTLVCTDRAGERALLQAIRELYQLDWKDKLPIDLRGRTDRYILGQLLNHVGREIGPGEENRLKTAYLSILPRTLPAGKARLQPGIQKALDAVQAHPEIHQGLLTGNLEEGARLKLTHLRIWHYFEFGAYADDSANRNELGPFALARAREKLGIDFAPGNVYIIGDTPHDIACGKAIGAKTIAVATGTFSVAELEAEKP